MPTENEKKWIAAWRSAGPELERIRREELRDMPEHSGLKLLGAMNVANESLNGLVIFQAWMSRLRILELQKQLELRSEG